MQSSARLSALGCLVIQLVATSSDVVPAPSFGQPGAPKGSSVHPSPPLQDDPDIDLLNTLLAGELPTIDTALRGAIPASYGSCSSKSPPQPCDEAGNLYYIHKSWEYKAYARWVGGLNTINLTSAVAARSSAPNGVSLRINGLFASLPTSIYIGECFTFDQCSILWDNTHACCGSNKHFAVDATIVCAANQSAANYPIDHISLAGVTVDKLEITEKIIGISINVKEITDTVASKVGDVIKTYLATEKFLPGPNGTEVTLVSYLNDNKMISQVASYLCTGTTTFV